MHPRVYDPVMGLALRTTTRVNRLLYAVSDGRLGRRFPGGAPVVWLTVTGARSGLPRRVPLLGARDGDAWVVTGSNAGQAAAPAWVHNLRAHPDAELEVDGRRLQVRATEADDDSERARLYGLMVGLWRGYARYGQQARRTIPVFRLTPRQRFSRDGSGRQGTPTAD
ncbi:MAG TPA: nitroreductase/quinone reductase family protein [Actinomycetes bacterium]